jgi:hypothetical protein
MNLALAPATLPANFSPVPALVAQNVIYPPVGGTNYKYAILADGDYRMPSISLSSSDKMIVRGRARLLVDGPTTVGGTNAQIIIAPDSNIEWYGRGTISLGGGGAFNQGYAVNLSFIALANAPVTYGGRAQLIGTIYAPLSSVALNGTTDLIGAVVCNNLTLVASMSIHFDENLLRVGRWR